MCLFDLDLDKRKVPTALKTSLVDYRGLHLDINLFLMDVTIFLCDLYISHFNIQSFIFMFIFEHGFLYICFRKLECMYGT